MRQYLRNLLRVFCALAAVTAVVMGMLAVAPAFAAEYHGQVTYNNLPVPGATVTAMQGGKKSVAVTDEQGNYLLTDLAEGVCSIQIDMTGFASVHQSVTVSGSVAAATVPAKTELKLMTLEEIRAATKAIKVTNVAAPTAMPSIASAGAGAKPQDKNAPPAAPERPADDNAAKAADGFLINGSVNNANTSQYAQSAAIGNTRNGGKGLYNGSLNLILSNSAFNAKPFSVTGIDSAKPSFSDATAGVAYGGPLKIPHLIPLFRAPYFFLNYQWTRNSNDQTLYGLVPDALERSGNLSELPQPIYNPSTGLAYGGNIVPVNSVAAALLNYYPMPNATNSTSGDNYQTAALGHTHQDVFQGRLSKSFGYKNQVFGIFAIQSTRTGTPNLFGFLDTSNLLGINSTISWNHEFSRELYLTTSYNYSRLKSQLVPNFENRINVSGLAGIANGIANPNSGGNDQDPADWGPPTLSFSSGINGLSDAVSANNRNQTNAYSASLSRYHGRHNITVGGDFRREEFNYLQQQNPQGQYNFTGAATQDPVSSTTASGSDLADFLIGIPDTSVIAYGNADKYFRENVYDAYFRDDWRLRPELTVNVGVRWEYGSPITELKNRLVNLDITSGFTAEAPVQASNPVGSLTNQKYPTSLIRPDRTGVEPRIGISWRPISGSSVVVRAGYGIYQDTSVYQATALSMAQQPPQVSPSKSLNVSNSATCPLTLANGFIPCTGTTPDTFAVDPNFRIGYAQAWQLQIQRDLPAALVMIATYSGIQGTHGVQEFLPNSYAVGGMSACPSCPVGFVYKTSNGSSTREAGQVQLRRRLRSGFTASAQYTYSKSIDDDYALGGQGPVAAGAVSQSSGSGSIAQNWQNLNAERSRSSFDQRNLLNLMVQYTTGMGLGGGSMLQGWKGRLYKEWTLQSTINTGSGLPETPVYLAAMPGTGSLGIGSLRADRGTAAIYAGSAGKFLNLAAFAPPVSGQFGNAGRNSITGPGQFAMNASIARTFRLKAKYNLDFRIDSTNVLNHVTYTNWYSSLNPVSNATANSTFNATTNPLFGSPTSTSGMRSLQSTLTLRF